MNSSIYNIYIKNFCFLSFVDSVYNKHNLSFFEWDCRYGIVAMGLSLWDCLVCCIAIMVKRLKNLIQIEVASIEAGNLSFCNPLIPLQDDLYILRIQLNVKTQPSCLFGCYQRCSATSKRL